MTHYKDFTKDHWDAALKEIEKKEYFKDEAKSEYALGKIKNGELFIIKGAETAMDKKLWVCAVFMSGKMIYVKHSASDRRLEVLKMKAVCHLMEVVQRGWADTKQAPWLPPRVQNLKNPDLVIHGAKSTDKLERVIGDGKGEQIIKEQEEIVDAVKDLKSETV